MGGNFTIIKGPEPFGEHERSRLTPPGMGCGEISLPSPTRVASEAGVGGVWAGPGQRKERGGWPGQGLGPTGVSGVSPRHKRPGSGGPLRCLAPLVPGWGDTSQVPSPSSPPQLLLPRPAPPRCAPRAGGWAAEYRIHLETDPL